MIITISGDIGSGKSTTGKLLMNKLGYLYLSTGAIQRKIAEEMNMTTLELNLLSETDTSIDNKIDSYTKALSESDENYIVDSRLAWHFIPSSYKVFLLCEDDIAADRIFHDHNRVSDEDTSTVLQLLAKIKDRRQSEKRRFLQKYSIDFEDLSNYDQVIDSSYFTPDEIAQLILDGIKLYSAEITQ
jgi:cytidylate kinase